MTVREMESRRDFLLLSTVTGAGLILGNTAGCTGAATSDAGQGKEGEVTATEDLMREHGVLRRALLVYTAAVSRLRRDPLSVPPDALQKAAGLFRTFGEDYHEKKLEESFIFPAVKRAGGPAAALADVLILQHQRGREITDYILALTKRGRLSGTDAGDLARVLEELVLMYRNHAAREDTVVFPAWKRTLTDRQLDEMGDKFEEIEQQMFGKDGFEDAVKKITEIEAGLGLSDLAQFTASPPPKS
ncbi:MAG TPA: hemerythrin domain-containing protein [Acidobacteriota bacterium]|nr:hemerythrin domain-containing protein [Acidobacteriota bacterium]